MDRLLGLLVAIELLRLLRGSLLTMLLLQVGAKSLNTALLSGALPSWLHQPLSATIPFGTLEHLLQLPENHVRGAACWACWPAAGSALHDTCCTCLLLRRRGSPQRGLLRPALARPGPQPTSSALPPLPHAQVASQRFEWAAADLSRFLASAAEAGQLAGRLEKLESALAGVREAVSELRCARQPA